MTDAGSEDLGMADSDMADGSEDLGEDLGGDSTSASDYYGKQRMTADSAAMRLHPTRMVLFQMEIT